MLPVQKLEAANAAGTSRSDLIAALMKARPALEYFIGLIKWPWLRWGARALLGLVDEFLASTVS